MLNEEQAVRKKFKEHAEEHGLCPAFKVFTLGSHGTVYVGCGLPLSHTTQPGGDDDDDGYIPFHQTQQGDPEGELVIFRWPVEGDDG